MADEPVYQSIQRHLLDQISSAVLLPGQKVPSENELARHFGVSRMTVQRAIRELVSRGIVTRRRGSGTYVSLAPWQFSLLEVRELAEEIKSRGGDPKRRVLTQEEVRAEGPVAARLEVEAGTSVYHAAILESDGPTAVAIVDRWSVTDVFPDFLAQNFDATTVFAYWASRTALDEVDLTVTAVLPSPDHSALLLVEPDEPCVQLHRTNRVRGRLITYTRITFAGDRLALSSRYRPMDRI
ncbi:MAG: UTRA domain-containing protein [Pseudomonadota bacterium]